MRGGFAYDDNYLDFGSAWVKLLPEFPSELAKRRAGVDRIETDDPRKLLDVVSTT